MRSDTRQKMVAGAADLLRRRGVHATSLREVVRRTDTPRGSLAHHFPGGKQELLEEAVRYAAATMAVSLERLLREQGVVAGLRSFVGWWRRTLEASAFEAGCPVLAVVVEPLEADERGGPADGDAPVDPAQGAQGRLLALAHDAFAQWQRLLAAALRREGVPPARARRLAALTVAAIEGTVAMCRAARDAAPLEDVRVELEAVLAAALAAGRR
jgi:AcrR family transcriptional regulator